MDIKDINVQPYVPRPGDRLIVRCSQPLNNEQRKHISNAVRKWAACDVRVIVLDPTITLTVESDIGNVNG